MSGECEREQEVLEMVRSGRPWQACDAELCEHVAACPLCADLVTVASALLTGHDEAFRSASVPSSGLVWWRAQRRARQEAAQTAARVATAIQAIALLCGVALVIGAFGLETMTTPLTTLAKWAVPLIVSMAVWLALAPVALYVALNGE